MTERICVAVARRVGCWLPSQNQLLANVCSIQAKAAGIPRYWPFDSPPRPAGYATIARRIHRARRDRTR